MKFCLTFEPDRLDFEFIKYFVNIWYNLLNILGIYDTIHSSHSFSFFVRIQELNSLNLLYNIYTVVIRSVFQGSIKRRVFPGSISDLRFTIRGSTFSFLESLWAFFFKVRESKLSFRIFVVRETTKFLLTLQSRQFAYILIPNVLTVHNFFILDCILRQTPNCGGYSATPYPLAVGICHLIIRIRYVFNGIHLVIIQKYFRCICFFPNCMFSNSGVLTHFQLIFNFYNPSFWMTIEVEHWLKMS